MEARTLRAYAGLCLVQATSKNRAINQSYTRIGGDIVGFGRSISGAACSTTITTTTTLEASSQAGTEIVNTL